MILILYLFAVSIISSDIFLPLSPASLNPADIGDLEAQADGRIKRKLHALGKLFAHSSPVVIIADGRGQHPIADALEGRGTVISSRQPKGRKRL